MTVAGSAASVPVPVPPHAPVPPPGPGVQPPFVTPPTDGTSARRWWALGLAGAAALVLCVGGLLGVGALFVFGTQAVLDQGHAAVTDYLTALQQKEFAEAYSLLCEREQEGTSEEEFIRTERAEPPIVSFTVGDAVFVNQLEVPATVRYGNGRVDDVQFLLEQDPKTGEFEICGHRPR